MLGDDVVVVGVHSGKYKTERRTEHIRHAALRHGVEHPIVNDRKFRIWRAYAVQAWPTLVFIGPDGGYIGAQAGEIPADAIVELGRRILAQHESRPKPPPLPLESRASTGSGALEYPAKILAHDETVYVADTGHGRVLEGVVERDRIVVRRELGKGALDAPHGMAREGDRLFVADPRAHRVWSIDLASGDTTPLVGTGEQAHGFPRAAVPADRAAISSPWDVVVHDGTAYLAMAGVHQLWGLDLEDNSVGRHAGSGREDIDDGPLDEATLAQPSGLTVHDGWLYFADAESSAVRRAGLHSGGRVETLVGTGLFESGDEDGVGPAVRLQHPTAVASWKNRVVIADTYNGVVKLLDPEERRVERLAEGFEEPEGLTVVGDHAYVVDTNRHRVVDVDLTSGEVVPLEIA